MAGAETGSIVGGMESGRRLGGVETIRLRLSARVANSIAAANPRPQSQ